MFRCAAIGDARTWLDCYYGAAQPARAALGLLPAPVRQVQLSRAPPASENVGDMAPRYDVTARALRCNGLSGEREWLDCYYGAAQPVRQQLGLPPAPQAAARPAPAPGVMAAMPAPASPKPAPVPGGDPNWSPMLSYNFDRLGHFTVRLVNGQVWQQISGDTNVAHWTKPASSYAARVKPGFMDSFNLTVRGQSIVYKVKQPS